MDSAFELPVGFSLNPVETAPQPSALRTFARLLEQTQATGSKNEKQDLVRAALAGDHGDHVLKLLTYALSPYVRFGVRQLPEPRAAALGAESADLSLVYATLDALAQRRLTGHAAQEAVATLLTLLDGSDAVSDREAIRRVLRKDLRAGFDASTVNKARPGTIPTFPYMRCSLVKDVKIAAFGWDAGVFSQEKADGMFANLDHTDSGAIVLSSRQGTEFPIEPFGALVEFAQAHLMRGTQSHGELLVEREGAVLPREIGNGILNSVANGGAFGPGERPLYLIWDQIPLSAVTPKGKHATPYAERLGAIAAQIPAHGLIRLIETRIVHSLDAAYAHYRALLAHGKEGTILKTRAAVWRDGTSKEQVKLKLEVDVDLEVVGFTEGNGKNAATFGAITCRTACGRLVVDVSGFSDAKRLELHENRAATIGRIMTVRANAIMAPAKAGGLHSLFLPRYVEIRSDKSTADCLDRVRDQFDSAIRV